MNFAVNSQDEITMTLESIAASGQLLTFDYTVNNYSPHPIYLLNNLPVQLDSGDLTVDPDRVYSWLENGQSLNLSKQMLVAPLGWPDVAREVPFVSFLESRWTMSETLRLSLPVQAIHPYMDQNQLKKLVGWSHFSFSLGYILADQPLKLDEIELANGSRQLRPDYFEAKRRQRLKRSSPVSVIRSN